MSALTAVPAPAPVASPVRYDGVDALLADARSRLDRISARAAFQELVALGALLVDIRPAAQRAREGEVARWLPALVVERNVLEWRFDPRSDARLPEASWHYWHNAETTASLVSKGEATHAILCSPVSVEQTRATAVAGERMPQKTTFFAPKPRTGLVLRALGDA